MLSHLDLRNGISNGIKDWAWLAHAVWEPDDPLDSLSEPAVRAAVGPGPNVFFFCLGKLLQTHRYVSNLLISAVLGWKTEIRLKQARLQGSHPHSAPDAMWRFFFGELQRQLLLKRTYSIIINVQINEMDILILHQPIIIVSWMKSANIIV